VTVSDGVDPAPAPEARRLAEIFGEVLPESTADDRDDGQDRAAARRDERWYAENRPPHHDR